MNPDPYASLDPDTPFRLDHVVNFLIALGLWAVIIVGVSAAILIYWRLHSPETFEERFATPARLLSWRLRAYITWHSLCRRCGLSASEQVTRRDKEGHQVTVTRWLHPKLLGTEVSHTTLRLTVRVKGSDKPWKTWSAPSLRSVMLLAHIQRERFSSRRGRCASS